LLDQETKGGTVGIALFGVAVDIGERLTVSTITLKPPAIVSTLQVQGIVSLAAALCRRLSAYDKASQSHAYQSAHGI